MPRVDFYILTNDLTRERFACDIAGKLRRQRLGLRIHANSEEQAHMLDDFMWTYKDISFLPHSLVGGDDSGNTITIGWEEATTTDNDVLINLSSDIPTYVESFNRVVEIVPAHGPDKQQARNRYQQYRQAGYELHNHEL